MTFNLTPASYADVLLARQAIKRPRRRLEANQVRCLILIHA